jgi:hypothetical protein
VEGAAEEVLKGAPAVLRHTLAVFVECENFQFWRDGSTVGSVTNVLQAGFVPVARDREYGDKQFNLLFIAGRVAHEMTPALFDARSPVRSCLLSSATPSPPASTPVRLFFSSVASYLQAEAPVFVPCFNNPTYTIGIVSQLKTLGFRHIALLDGGSTFPAMCEFLVAPGDCVSVVSLPTNPGPRHIFGDPAAYALLPRHFCVTDPDLAFNPAMPPDFLGDLAALAAREQMGKVGLALDISDHEAMRDETFLIGGQRWRIWEWEEQFWRDELSPLRPGGDPVYRALLDTTFALYDRNFFSPARYLEALRVAGRFTCQHLPWRRNMQLPKNEEQFYHKTQKFSYYIRDPGSEPSHVI